MGIEMGHPDRDLIPLVLGRTDLDLLDSWVRRAATITTVDELFG